MSESVSEEGSEPENQSRNRLIDAIFSFDVDHTSADYTLSE